MPLPIKYSYGLELEMETVIGSPPMGVIITSIGFNYYVNNFSQYNKVYGSIGTLMIILIWMYFNSIILLTGFELNASISNAKEKDIKLE